MTEINKERFDIVIPEFADLYMKPPYDKYVCLCASTQRFMVEWLAKGRVFSLDETKADLLERGENPEEWMILVGLRKQLPGEISVPSTYKGISILVDVIGEPDLEGE